MQYKVLGLSGLRVSTICLGTARFGVAPLEEDASRLVHRALDLGINFIDTANSYGNQSRFDREGVPPADQRKGAEELVGDALRGRRDKVVVATKVQEKVGEGPNDGGPMGGGLTRKHIIQQVEQSLRRLQTDYIDIYYMHHVDPTTPMDQTLRTFDDLIRDGKVRCAAISNFPAWKMMEALWTADRLQLSRPVATEMPYNLVNRMVEQEVAPACLQYGLSITAFIPLAQGLLAGPQIRSRQYIGRRRAGGWQGAAFSETDLQMAGRFDDLCEQWGLPYTHVALAWLISRPYVASAIIGAENIEELEQSLPASELKLDPEQIAALDEIAPPPRGPGW